MGLLGVLHGLHRDESGQDVLEYALVLFAVAGAAVAGSSSIASVISSALVAINNKMSTTIS